MKERRFEGSGDDVEALWKLCGSFRDCGETSRTFKKLQRLSRCFNDSGKVSGNLGKLQGT
jgi:hypothetical protein